MKQSDANPTRTIWQVPNLAIAGTTTQDESSRITRLSIDYVVLAWIRRGKRILRWEGNEQVIEAGQAAVTAPGVFDIENIPLSDTESYESHWIAWNLDTLGTIKIDAPCEMTTVNGAVLLPQPSPVFLEGYQRARTALRLHDNFPAEIVRHRAMEPLIWLATNGLRFAVPTANQLSQKIRVMVTDTPATEWTIRMLADAFSMSEATLRRRLVGERTTASELITDARMLYALAMLQSTNFSISRVALDCGYASASRFALRFRERFGIPPSTLRGHQRAHRPAPGGALPRQCGIGRCISLGCGKADRIGQTRS